MMSNKGKKQRNLFCSAITLELNVVIEQDNLFLYWINYSQDKT